MKKSLQLISLLILSGCTPALYSDLQNSSPTTDCIGNFKPEFTSQWYTAQINITNKHLSGLLFFKTMDDSSKRVVFTSETGVTLFDFSFAVDHFKVIYITPKLNKKVIIATLQSDLGMILHHLNESKEQIFKKNDELIYTGYKDGKDIIWYLIRSDCSELISIEKNSKRKKKIIVNLSMKGNALPDSVYIEHQSFNFNISLNKINK